MASWIILAILIALIFLVFKVRHFRHRIFTIVLILLVIFFYLTIPQVILNNDVDLKSFNGIIKAGKLYVIWLGQSFNNLKILTGQALGMDWVGNRTKKTLQEWEDW